jgi:hypothetical protein
VIKVHGVLCLERGFVRDKSTLSSVNFLIRDLDIQLEHIYKICTGV